MSTEPPAWSTNRMRNITAHLGMMCIAAVVLTGCGQDTSTPPTPASPAARESEKTQVADLDSPESVTVMVNKRRPLDPQNYAPKDLRKVDGEHLRVEAANSLQQMLADMRNDGITVTVLSAYRSYKTQESTYQHWVKENGQFAADQLSARPGFSEHQTGLAVDLGDGSGCDLQACFADTQAAQWARENAFKYGFVLRFPADQGAVTGYTYEPWHFRYIGEDHAAAFTKSSASTLEEFYGTGPAPDYS